MIKIFLVEDEAIIRKSIKNNLDWEKNGFLFAGEAADGEMALPMIQQAKPDIVITDIRMPFMDGLELSRILKKEMPEITIIILSGYGEFDYAREAIKIGVTEYLSKPITGEQLLEALNQVKKKILKKRKQKEVAEEILQEKEQNLRSRQYQFLGDLIRSRMPISELLEKGEELGLQLMAAAYNFMMLKIYFKESEKSEVDYSGFRKEADDIVEKSAKENKNILIFRRATEGYVFMIKGQDVSEIDQTIQRYLECFKETMKEHRDMDYFIGIGHPVTRIRDLAKSYDSTGKAFTYQYAPDRDGVIFFDEIDAEKIEEKKENVPWDFGNVDFQKLNMDYLRNFLKNGDMDQVHQFVEEYIEGFGKSNMDSFMFCQYTLINLQMKVIHFMGEMGMNPQDLENEFQDYQTQITKILTSQKAIEYIEELLEAVLRIRNRNLLKKHSSVIEEAQAFLLENYQNENLSLNVVASEVGLSSSHFSTIFKQETGRSFVEFLAQIRMEKAKELLRFTDKKVAEISYAIGYKDPHYFSYLFKKNQGCTPKEYRLRGIQ